MNDKDRRKGVLIIGEEPDDDESTQAMPRGGRDDDDATETIKRGVSSSRPGQRRKAPPPPPSMVTGRKKPLLQPASSEAPEAEDEIDETAPMPRRLSQLEAVESATHPVGASAEDIRVLRGTVTPGRTNAFRMKGEGDPRQLSDLPEPSFAPAEEIQAPEPRVLKGTVTPGRTSSFTLSPSGQLEAIPERPVDVQEAQMDCWRLQVNAPEGASVSIDGVACGQGVVTIEGEVPGLSVLVEVKLPNGRRWNARQQIDERRLYVITPSV